MILTVQIVNYNSRGALLDCLDSVLKNRPENIEMQIIVVNNELEEIGNDLSAFPEAEIIEVGRNLGFGRAHNLGAKQARGKFIFFLNPDARVFPGSIARLVDIFGSDEKIGVVGPLLVGESGKVEEEHCGFLKSPLSLMRSKIFPGANNFVDPREVDWVSGGAMMIRKNLFEELGGFDEKFFMYFEDVDLCLQMKKKDYRVIVNPKARIFHRSGQSFSDNRLRKKHYYASQSYYLQKNFGSWRAGIAKILRFPFYVKNVYFG
jgi:GT2 family glycosyltransferase